MKTITKYILGATAGLGLLANSAFADKICVAGNFDGDKVKAGMISDFCKEQNSDAILLMGDYSVRGLPGETNYRTDFVSTKRVLDKFADSKTPVFVLSGGNDSLRDVRQISESYENMHALEDNVKTKIADLDVIPLNGYNNKRFMFEGAKFVSEKDLDNYLQKLSENPDAVSVSHIAPYGDVDVVPNIGSAGERKLEKVLQKNNIDSISNAIRESPSKKKIHNRWKINPSVFPVIINTNGKGKIKKVDFYRVRK
ncbi:MAG: metallophosphoesterase [Candidatus Pacearchaeota archaeon]